MYPNGINFPGIKMSQQMSCSSNRLNEFKKENSVLVLFINFRPCTILMSMILVGVQSLNKKVENEKVKVFKDLLQKV